jgi:hypothetical protein
LTVKQHKRKTKYYMSTIREMIGTYPIPQIGQEPQRVDAAAALVDGIDGFALPEQLGTVVEGLQEAIRLDQEVDSNALRSFDQNPVECGASLAKLAQYAVEHSRYSKAQSLADAALLAHEALSESEFRALRVQNLLARSVANLTAARAGEVVDELFVPWESPILAPQHRDEKVEEGLRTLLRIHTNQGRTARLTGMHDQAKEHAMRARDTLDTGNNQAAIPYSDRLWTAALCYEEKVGTTLSPIRKITQRILGRKNPPDDNRSDIKTIIGHQPLNELSRLRADMHREGYTRTLTLVDSVMRDRYERLARTACAENLFVPGFEAHQNSLGEAVVVKVRTKKQPDYNFYMHPLPRTSGHDPVTTEREPSTAIEDLAPSASLDSREGQAPIRKTTRIQLGLDKWDQAEKAFNTFQAELAQATADTQALQAALGETGEDEGAVRLSKLVTLESTKEWPNHIYAPTSD